MWHSLVACGTVSGMHRMCRASVIKVGLAASVVATEATIMYREAIVSLVVPVPAVRDLVVVAAYNPPERENVRAESASVSRNPIKRVGPHPPPGSA